MSKEHDTLVCSLRLLFDGKNVKDVASAVCEATSSYGMYSFHNEYEDAAKCWAIYSVYPGWVKDLLGDEAEHGDFNGWFVGDEAAYEHITRAMLDSIADNTYDAIRDDLRAGVMEMIDNNPQWFVSEDVAVEAAEEAGVELNL